MSISSKIILAFVSILIAIGVFINLYNEYIFKLGRLHRSIKIGDSYEQVYLKYKSYINGRPISECLQYKEGETETDFYGMPVFKSRFLDIYDCSSPFDDAHFGVLFDAKNKVFQNYYVGD